MWLRSWSVLDSGNSIDCWGSYTIRAPPAGEVFGLVIDSVLLTKIQEFQLCKAWNSSGYKNPYIQSNLFSGQ